MPKYKVFQESTGVTLYLEGDKEPDLEDIEKAFAFVGQQKSATAPTYGLGGAVLQAPPSLYEQAKAVAPSLARVAAPLAFGTPMPQDIATTGRVLQQGSEAVRRLTGGVEKPEELLQGASRIEREGIMALGAASQEKRERAARIGRSLGETVSEYTPIPEYVTRPAGEVFGQVSADLLSPMNVMSLGIAGAARQATRIPSLVAGAEFAETTTPAAVRAAQIADLRRASGKGAFPEWLQKELVESGGNVLKDSKNAVEQVGDLIPGLLTPEITRGAAESAGIAMQTAVDPNATAEERLKASYEALIGTLFAAGLGTQAARSLGIRGKGVTQADVLEGLASQKKTVGEAINQVSGLIDQMDRIVPVENFKDQFRKLTSELNPDDPFVYQRETVGEGVRERTKFLTEEERAALQKEEAAVEQQRKAEEAGQQAALEQAAEASGTPLKSAEELFRERNRPPVIVNEEQVALAREQASEQARREAAIKSRREAARDIGQPPVIEPEAVSEGTPFRSVADVLNERLRARDERIAAETEAARPETLRTSEDVQAQRAAERQAFRERAAAIRRVLGRREFTAEDLMRGEVAPEAPVVEPVSRPIITPEIATERPAPREGGMLPTREAVEAEGTPLRSVEDILAERLRVRDERIAAQQQPTARTSTPLETVEQKLSRALAQRDRRLAAEAVAETLESGAAQGESVRATRKKVEQAIGVGRKEAGLPVAERTIFNEVWEKALEETQGKFRKKAEGVAEKLEGLRVEVEPGVGANPFPQLMGSAWNGSLSVAQAFIRAGGSVADAVAAGLRYARENFKGKFNEAEFVAELTRTIQRPSPIQVPPKMEARAFAERVAAAPGVPPVIREAVAKSTRASYLPQNIEQVVDQVSVATPEQLNADLGNAKSNTRVASGMELFSRLMNEGRVQEATDLSLQLAESGTTWGQLINQFKLLKSASREGVIQLVTKSMAERGRKITPEQATKLGDAMDQYRGAVDAVKRAEMQMKDAADKGDVNGLKNAFSVRDKADAILGKANFDLLERIYRLNPASATDLYISLVQGSVMAPLSIWKNTVYNAIRKPPNAIADMLAAGIDNAFYGGENNSYNIRARTVTQIKEFAKSIPDAFKVMLKGSDFNPYELGTSVGSPLNFQRAWRKIAEDFASGNYGEAFSPRILAEGTLGIYSDILLRAAQATDLPFRKAKYASIIEELGKKRGLSDLQIRVATRNPKLMLISDEAKAAGQRGFTADDLGRIDFLSAREVYQQENDTTRAFAGANRFFRDVAGPVGYIPYRIAQLFQKTPINVMAEALQYMPTGFVRKWGQLSQAERNIASSRLLVGSIIGTAFYYLYGKGIITPNLDTPGETNKARELAKSGGVMPPGTINSSGLRRLIRGEDPTFRKDDEVKELAGIGVTGAIGLMVATLRRLQERSRTDDPDLTVMLKAAGISGLNYIMEQQFLKGTSSVIKMLSEESGTAMDRLLKNMVVTAASPVAPAILGAKRRAERETLPSIGGEGFIRDSINEINQRYAALGLAIPGAKDPNAMPVRRDLWGEAVEQTPKGENPWVYNFFDAWKSRSIEADPLNSSIYTLWRRTADNKAIPSVPNPVMTYHDKTFDRMNPEQFDRYSQLVGFYRRGLAERVFTSGQYQQSGDEVKLRLLNAAYDRGLAVGKYVFLKELAESGQSLIPQAPRRGFQQPSE